MLTNTFCHIPGIGQRREERLWASGFRHWDDCLGPGRVPALSPLASRHMVEWLHASREHLQRGDPGFFASAMPPGHLWRLFPEFRDEVAYLDIETTGLGGPQSVITSIALYDGRAISWFVQGQNLHEFPEAASRYKILVTYNGKCFDLPFLQRFFRMPFGQPHIDLRYLLGSLGYKGGLKGCERQLGISRGDLERVDGYFAVLLWEEYERHGREEALQTLLAYNIQDTVNLETLMVKAYNLKLRETPFAATHELPLPRVPALPFQPDRETIERVRSKISGDASSRHVHIEIRLEDVFGSLQSVLKRKFSGGRD